MGGEEVGGARLVYRARSLLRCCAPSPELLSACREAISSLSTPDVASKHRLAAALLLRLLRDEKAHCSEHSRRALRAVLRSLEDAAVQDPPFFEELHETLGDALLRCAEAKGEGDSGPGQRELWMRSFSYAPPGAAEELGRLWARSAADDLLAHGTGAWPWAAGVSAAELALSRPDLFADRRVLELGCGCGLAGVALALAQPPPASVTLTDANAAAVANARRNLEANGARAEVLELAWEEVTPARAAALRPSIVIAADVIYDPEAIPALVGALRNLLSAAEADAFALILVTPRRLASLACFLETCAASHLSVQDATEDLLHGGGAMPVGFEHLPAAVAEERRRVRAYRILLRASE